MKSSLIPIIIPLLNANEPNSLLTSLPVTEGQYITKGDLICTLETTKATSEVTADASGYIVGLRINKGQTVEAGQILAFLAARPDIKPPEEESIPIQEESISDSALLLRLRITDPAKRLIKQHGLTLDKFPDRELVTTKVVRDILEKQKVALSSGDLQEKYPTNALIIYGGGGHGKMTIDLLKARDDYQIVGIIDDGMPVGTTVLGVPVLGGKGVLPKLYSQGVRLAVNAVGGIGNPQSREKVFQILKETGFSTPAIVHPSALIELSAHISDGVHVMAQAYVGSAAQIGFGALINTGAIVSHDCIVADQAIISPGAILAGEVQVGKCTLIGMGVTVNLQVRIGSYARVGNGATVKADIPEGSIVRAGAVWPA